MDAFTSAEVINEDWLGVGKMYVSIDNKYSVQQRYSIQWFMSWLFGKSLTWIKLYSRSFGIKSPGQTDSTGSWWGDPEPPKYLSYTKDLAWIEVWYIIKYFVFQRYDFLETILWDSKECCRKGCWEHCPRRNVGSLLTMWPELYHFLSVLYLVV